MGGSDWGGRTWGRTGGVEVKFGSGKVTSRSVTVTVEAVTAS